MRKKKIIIVAIIALLVIIGIVVGIILLTGKEKNYETSKLTDIYNDLIASDIYSFSITQNDENKTIMAKNGEQTAIDQYLGDTHSTTIVKDGNTYLVLKTVIKNLGTEILAGEKLPKGKLIYDEKYKLNNANYAYPIALASNEFVGDKASFSFKSGLLCVIQSKD